MIRALLALILALAVVFGGLFAIARTIGRVRLSNLADVFTTFTVKDHNAFPYAVDAGTVERMAAFGNGVGVLRADSFDVLTRSGATLQSARHTYLSPAVDICGGRALVYDRGGERYMLLSKTTVLREGTVAVQLEGNPKTKTRTILTAALAPDGRVAIATTSETVKSELTVYKTSGEEFFRFKCAAEYITDITFTSGGVALTVVGVKDATAYSRLLVLRFDRTEPVADFRYDGTSLFHVHASSSYITACSSTLLTTLRRQVQQPEVNFGADALAFFCEDEGGKTTLVLQSYGNEHDTKLRGLQPGGKTAFEADCGQKLKDATRSSVYTSVLTEDTVLTYNNSGSNVGTLRLAQAARAICLNDRTVFVLFNDHIDAFPAAGEHEQPDENAQAATEKSEQPAQSEPAQSTTQPAESTTQPAESTTQPAQSTAADGNG